MGVHETRLFTVERETAEDEDIRETLDPETDGTVFHVGASSRFDRVKVTVYDPIQVLDDCFRDLMEFLVLERFGFFVYVFGEGEGGQVTYGCFILVGKFQNFCAVPSDNTVKHATMFEWFIETEGVCGVSQVFNGNDLHVIVNTSIRERVFNNFHIFFEMLRFDGCIVSDDPELVVRGTSNRETFTRIDREKFLVLACLMNGDF